MGDFISNATDTYVTTVAYILADDPVFQSAKSLRFVYIWVLIVLGVPGNAACLLTITSMRVTTATFYVALLAVADEIALVLKLVFHQLATYHMLPATGAGCRVFNLVVELSSCYANWMLVLVCLERFVSVRYPLKKYVYFTKKRAYASSAVLFLVLLFCFSHYLYNQGYCVPKDQLDMRFLEVWGWIHSALYFFMPFVVVAVLTLLIVVCLHRYRRARQSMILQTSGGSDDRNMERAISIMLVSAAGVFLILALPTCIYHLLNDAVLVAMGVTTRGRRFMFYQLTTIMADTSHAVNFFVYFVSTARFRHRFLELVGLRHPPWRCGRARNPTPDMSGNGKATDATQYISMTVSKENLQADTAI